MREATIDDVKEVRRHLSHGNPLSNIVPLVLGGATTDGGFWRFFGGKALGLLSQAEWNAPDLWKHAWHGLASWQFCGEDVFGNQILLDHQGKVALWNHENAVIMPIDIELDVALETSLDRGLSWIDFYGDGSYLLAKDRSRALSIDSHWHWIQPIILGGRPTVENMAPIKRVQHMVGHGQLWVQVRGLPAGTQIIPKSVS